MQYIETAVLAAQRDDLCQEMAYCKEPARRAELIVLIDDLNEILDERDDD